MGAYLTHPITDKVSTDESNGKFSFGVSSMQGWRKTQEDAHNSILNFDENSSLFAVYDGHGGKEVAEYTATKLPDVIRSTDSYKNGDYEQALKDAFLQFDATLKQPEVIAVLKEIAGTEGDETPSEEDENLGHLRAEAQMPIEDVVAKYVANAENANIQKLKNEGKLFSGPVSPFLRGKGITSSKNSLDSEEVSSCRSECSSSAGGSKQSLENDSEVSSSSGTCSIARKSLSEKYRNGETDESLDSTSSNAADAVEEGSGTSSKTTVAVKEDSDLPDSSGDANKTENISKPSPCLLNGNREAHSEVKVDEAISSSVENGEAKGKGKALMKKQAKSPQKDPKEILEHLFQRFVNADPIDETSESESEDVTFQGPDTPSDDDEEPTEEKEEGSEGDEDSAEEDTDDDDDEEEDEEEMDENDEFTMNINEEPGSDSGCTAVVALIKGDKLFVANAGDSRCVLSKGGEVVEMSLDHKPEDELEMARIVKAGGKVTVDGRVNGGLNLSRALGDHAYKQVADIAPEEQMISPMPDVKTIDVSPDMEFMILACDGIWNFMSSKEVVEFVRPRLQNMVKGTPISKICEELFDHCLAPDTVGDGTGCDNMTAVIVLFQDVSLWANKKRKAEEDVEVELKRPKTDEAPAEAPEVGSSGEAAPDTTQ